MSAFKVDNQTINKIVSWLSYEQYDKSNPTYGRCAKEILKNEQYQNINILNENTLAQDMHTLNEHSLHQRYQDAQEMYNNNREYIPCGRCSLPEVYKAISCWMYQSCEGDCDQRPLFKVFEKIKHILASSFMEESKGYDLAYWG